MALSLDEWYKKKKDEEEKNKALDEWYKLKKSKQAKSPTIERKNYEIAPVKEEKTWFTKGAFDDDKGTFASDLYDTIRGTSKDLATNLYAGVTGLVEKTIDAGAYIVGGVGGLFGADDFKNKTAEFIAKDIINEEKVGEVLAGTSGGYLNEAIFGKIDADENSVLGEKSDSLVQSGGQLLGTVGLQAVGVPWFVTTGVTSFGSGAEEAFQEGASYGEAGLSAAITAGADILTEKLFGGSGLGEKGLINLDGLTKGISSKVVKALADYGVDVAAEGFEEVSAGIITNLGSALYKEDNLKDILFSEEAVDEYIESFVGGAVLGGGMNAGKLGNSIKQGIDYRTGLNSIEKKVFDKVYKDEIAKAEEKGKKLTSKEKSEIYDSVVEQMDKGYISTDTIEEVLGGETYRAYKEAIDSEEALKKEYAELRQMKKGEMNDIQQDRLAELKEMDLEDTSKRDELKTRLDKEISELIKGSRLAESYNERARRGQVFEADLTQYNEKQRRIVQKAIDSGVLNNTNRSHELVDLIAKVGADKDLDFDFADNEKLKKSGFALDGVIVNGFLSDGSVTVNVNSQKALNSVVGHEIAHVLEGTDLYNSLQSELKNYLGDAEYNKRLDSVRKTYKNIYTGEDAETRFEQELTADLVGDLLFTDSDFVNRLYVGNRNVFQKLFDEIKYLCRVVTAGSKEAKQLEKVKKAFEDAYSSGTKAQKNTATEDGAIRWSISSKLSSDIDSVLKGTFDASKSEVYLGETSNFLTDVIGAESLSLYMPASKVYSSIVSEEEYNKNPYYAKQDNYHGIGKDDFIEILEKSENPIAAFASRADEKGNKRENRIVLVTDKLLLDKQTGETGYAVVVEEVDSFARHQGKQLKANKTITVYPRTQLNSDITEAIADGRILDMTKKGEQLLAGRRGSNPQATIQETVLKKNIANFWANVKWKKTKNKTASSSSANSSGFSTMKDALLKAGYIDQDGHIQDMQENRKNSLSAENEDIAPIKNGIYGKDVVLQNEDIAPLKETISKKETVKEDLAPVREDVMPTVKKVLSKDIAPVTERRKQKGKGEKQRRWVKTSTESEVVNREILPDDLDQSKITYLPISNRETLGRANLKLSSMGYKTAVRYFNDQIYSQNVSVDDIALGERLIQEAIKNGDKKTAGELIQDMAILGTELGQKVQALSIINKMTPEGQLKMLQKIITRGKARGDRVFADVELSEEIADCILGVYEDDGSYDQSALDRAVEEAKQIIADRMKVTKMEKVNAWRYLSMLGNPKTHIRNVVSNVAMLGTTKVKDVIARTIETFAPIGSRTKTWKPSTDMVRAFAKQTANQMKSEIVGERKYSDSSDIKSKRKIFKNQILQKVYDFNNEMLGKEDWWFSKADFESSFREFLTANGIKTDEDIKNNSELIEKGKRYALERSEIATFRQYSWLANKITSIERKNMATQIAVGSVIPFKKTSVNVAKAGLNYSPLGFAKTLTYDITQVKKGNMEASTLIDHLSQNITGTSLALIGYLLAQSGFLNGAGDDDKEGTYDYHLGKQAYSVNIGGNTYSLSWISPASMPLFVGANAYEQLVEGKEWNADVVMQTLAQTLDPMSEMSFLSSLDEVLSSYDSGVEKFASIAVSSGQNYASQFVPSLLGQIASTTDDTKRSTRVSADSGTKMIDEVINQLKYKIPGLRQTLEPSTDIWGNEIKQSENITLRATESFIVPWSKKEDISTDIDLELKSLYDEVGEDDLLPSIPRNSITYKNEKYSMSANEHTEFKKSYGQISNDLLERLFKTETYQNASSEDKADMVSDVYTHASDVAKKNFLAKEGVEYTNTSKDKVPYYKENSIKGAIESDMTAAEYNYSVEYPEKHAVSKAVGGYKAYKSYTSELNKIKADKDNSGESISGSRKEKVIKYIDGLDADYGEKIILFKSEYPGDDTYNYDIVEYLNSREDISRLQMEIILKELGFTVLSDGTVRW